MKLAVTVLCYVDVVIGELCALMVEGGRICKHFLEGRCSDLVGPWVAVDRVEGTGVCDFEDAVGVVVEIEAG